MVARVHTLLPQSYDWSGADGKPGASEDKRERAEVQRAYYGFLNALAQSQLLQCLQVSASPLLHSNPGMSRMHPVRALSYVKC